MTNTILSIEGMHCASCASRIEKQLKTVPGDSFHTPAALMGKKDDDTEKKEL